MAQHGGHLAWESIACFVDPPASDTSWMPLLCLLSCYRRARSHPDIAATLAQVHHQMVPPDGETAHAEGYAVHRAASFMKVPYRKGFAGRLAGASIDPPRPDAESFVRIRDEIEHPAVRRP